MSFKDKLGYETKQAIKRIALSSTQFNEKINQLNEMSLDDFNKVLLHPQGTVIDKRIDINYSGNNQIVTEWHILFNYKIGGYPKEILNALPTQQYLFRYADRESNVFDLSQARHYWENPFIQRKGGIFYMVLYYTYNMSNPEKSFIKNKIQRTIWSLLIPDQGNEMGITHDDLGEVISDIIHLRYQYSPSIQNHIHTIELLQSEQEGCDTDHSDDYCDGYDDCPEYGEEDGYCDYGHYESDEEYCSHNCDRTRAFNKLALFYTHPHFFSSMSNFCTGNQFTANKVLSEQSKNPNPIQFMAEMIRVVNSVNWGDAYNSMYYYQTVFDLSKNPFEFSRRPMNRLRRRCIEVDQNYNFVLNDIKRMSHQLTLDCYCFDCLDFRFLLNQGLRFDPTKLLFGSIPFCTKEQALNEIEKARHDLMDTDYHTIQGIISIDIMNPKWHIEPHNDLNQLWVMGVRSNQQVFGWFENEGVIYPLTFGELGSGFKKVVNSYNGINGLTQFHNTYFSENNQPITITKEISDVMNILIKIKNDPLSAIINSRNFVIE